MNISKFDQKFNKLEGNIYTVEEEIMLVNGVYNGPLAHDNINKKTVNIYTGSRLTGDKITNYFLSTPSETPWKYTIKILANIDKAYLTYETVGDQVESEDINNLQNEIVRTQQEINSYEQSNDEKVNSIDTRVVNIETNKADKEKVFTKEETLQQIADLINAAPQTLDTFKEIADALGNDPNFATTIINLLGNKVDEVDGKQLSTEDYSTAEKSKLTNIQDNANNYVHPEIHPASMITEDENHMFVTSEEKAAIKTSGGDLVFQIAEGTGTAITLAVSSLVNGYSKTFIASANNSGAATTINGKQLYKPGATTSPNLVIGKAYTVWYNLAGDCFFIKASAEGTALAKDVRKNTTFSNYNDTVIPGGLDLSLLVSGNIKAGITIDGISRKSSVVDTADALATAAQLLNGVSAYVNGNKIVGNIANNYGVWQYAQSIQPTSGRLHMYPPKGYYDPSGGTGIYYDDANYVSANIVSGKSILGLGGTATLSSLGGIQYTEVVVNHVSGTMQDINLPFLPTLLVCSNYVCMPAYSSNIYRLGSTATSNYYELMNSGSGGYVIRIAGTYATGTLVFKLYK